LPQARIASAMLLVENLPQPVGRANIGQAIACEGRLQLESPRRVQCRQIAAGLSRWTELVFQL
jgi:hypothetical protein